MKKVKGFKGKYFSLTAILACTVSVSLSAHESSIQENDIRVQKVDKKIENEESEDILLGKISVYEIKQKKTKEFSSLRTLKGSTKSTDSIEIITAEEIALKGFQTLPQILNIVSGISSTNSGAIGQPTSIYTRGLNPAHTLVLIDGVKVNDVSGLSGAQIELIDIYNVQRIEIVRGAQSGIWGADASAGVINIITKNPKDGVVQNIGAEFGSNRWQKYSIGVGFANEVFDASFGGSYIENKGISAAAPKKSSPDYGKDTKKLGWERDKFQSKTLYAKAGLNLNDENRLEFSIRHNDANTHFDGGAGVDKDDYDPFGPYFNTIKTDIYSLGFIGDYDKSKINIRANYSNFKRSFYGGYHGKSYEVYASDELFYNKSDAFIFGAGYSKDKVKKSAGAKLDISSQENQYIFLSNMNEVKNLILTQSLRYDAHNRFKNKFTAKVGVRYNFYSDWFLMSSYKTGYKVPTLYQQSYQQTVSLDAEETSTYEATFGNSFFDITYFNTDVKNAIDYGGWWPNDYYYNIAGKSKFKGVEFNARCDLFDSLLAEISYTYLSAKDTNKARIIRRPKTKIDGSLLYFVDKNFSMNLRGSYIGARKDIDNVQTGNYFLADYTINYQADKNINLYLKIYNLFDKYYQELDGYGTLGRSYYVGFRSQF